MMPKVVVRADDGADEKRTEQALARLNVKAVETIKRLAKLGLRPHTIGERYDLRGDEVEHIVKFTEIED